MPASKFGQFPEKSTTSSYFSEMSLITHEWLKDIMEDRLNSRKFQPFQVSCKSLIGGSKFPFCLDRKCNLSADIISPSGTGISKVDHRNSNAQTINFIGEHQNSSDNKAIGVFSPTKIAANKTFADVVHDDLEDHDHKPLRVLDSLENAHIKMASDDTIKSDDELLEDILLLDCRSFLSYNEGHIKTAQNVHFPNILQRRCKKKIAENITKCRTNDVAIVDEHGDDVTGPLGKTFSSHEAANIQRPFEGSVKCDISIENQASKCISKPSQHFFSSRTTSSENLMIPLESLVTSDRHRKRLLLGDYDLVVIYDDHSEHNQTCLTINQQVPFSENLILVMNTLSSSLPQKQLAKLRCLRGGYSTFARLHPQLIEKQELTFERFSPPPSGAKNAFPDKDRIKWTAHSDTTDPTEILPWLFLGSAHHADQTNRLIDLGITALLNVASSEAKDSSVKEDVNSLSSSSMHHQLTFQQACIPMVDSLTSDIGCLLQSAVEFIEEVHQNNGKVLVHCSAGVSRSPAVCLAYLINTLNYCLEDAYDFLRSKRACIAPNLNFMRQLQEFERSHKSKCNIANSSANRLQNDEARNKSFLTNSKFSYNFDPSLFCSVRNGTADRAGGGTRALIKYVDPMKKVRHRKKDKLVTTCAPLYMKANEKDVSLKIIQHKLSNVFLHTYKKCSNENPMSRKWAFYLLSLLISRKTKPTAPMILRNSQFFKDSLTQAFSLEGVEHPIALSFLDVNIRKRSNRKFLLLNRDFNEKKICSRSKKDLIKIHRMADPHCSESEKDQKEKREELCDCLALQQSTRKVKKCGFSGGQNIILAQKNLFINDVVINEDLHSSTDCISSDTRSDSNSISNERCHEKTRSSDNPMNVENETLSPAKRLRPSSLINVRPCNSRTSFNKLSQSWQHVDGSCRTFPASLPFTINSATSLPQSPERTHIQEFSVLTSSLGSLQQPFSSNILPMLLTSSLEAASHQLSPDLSPQGLCSHVQSKRKIFVSILTPTCNQEAAFSFEPCQTHSPIGGLLPSPTVCHSPLLSPS